MDFICLCIRVPKSGSSSLSHALNAAFAERRTFFLPDTLNLDGRHSAFQRWRFQRARKGALRAHYGDPRLASALATINADARPGDLIAGGHFDFGFARQALSRPARAIAMLRDPVARCVSEYNYARQNHLARDVFKRIDSKTQPKIAARYDLVGYLDYLLDRRETYGDLASQYLGWDGAQPLDRFFETAVFHAGVLEDSATFAFGLAEKLGRPVDFPWANSTLDRKAQAADAAARRRIEQLYARDFELYEHVRAETRKAARRISALRRKATEAEPASFTRTDRPDAASGLN
ncbi:MAG: sulfotransferase family 2 domain-containing protein [Caulobacteraceae bacterium]|nr:sulfotransferase family 2 domain-containing protein [Caulobacteraceae bacterium]